MSTAFAGAEVHPGIEGHYNGRQVPFSVGCGPPNHTV